MNQRQLRSVIPLAAATWLATAGCAGVGAQETSLQLEVASLAQDVKRALAGKETAIAVGSFTASSRLPASAGPAITLALRRELLRRDLTVRDDARLRVEGKYKDVIDKESEGLAVALIAQIVQQDTGKPVTGLQLKPRGVFGDASIAALMGVSTELPPGLSRKERDETLRVVIDKPRVEIRKAYYRPELPPGPIQVSAPESKFRMEILIKEGEGYVPRPLDTRGGEAFVPIKRKEVYAVRLVNEHDFEIAVQLTIDGLSMFAFADGNNPKTGAAFHSVIIGPKSKTTVYGWYRNEKQMNEFLVTEYAHSAAAELMSVDRVGSVTASYCASWPPDGKPPADEPKEPARHAKSADATARGLLVEKESESLARTLGVVRGSVTVRYAKEK
jgi:hypothetical protein